MLFNNGFFFFRFVNGVFGSKWCGFWDVDKKLMEYFAFKVGDEWLSKDNQVGFEYNGVSAKHIYKTKIGKVEEKIALGDSLVVELALPKKAEVWLKLAANLRKRDENIHGRQYTVVSRGRKLTVKNNLGELHASFSGALEKTPAYEKHLPGKYAREAGYDWREEEQECFVPGMVKTKSRQFVLKLSTGKAEGTVKEIAKAGRKRIRKKAVNLNLGPDLSWKTTASVMAHLVDRTKAKKTGFMAGFPYFNEFWTRDFLWMVPSLLHMGFEEEVGRELKSIARAVAKTGDVPMILDAEATCSDSTPLFVFAAGRYLQSSMEAPGSFKTAIEKVVAKGIESKRGGLIVHKPLYTWMDTVERELAVEIQVLWAKAFEVASGILKRPHLLEESNKLWEKINDNYWNGNFYLDSLRGPYEFTCNSLIPFIFQNSYGDKFTKTVDRMKEELLMDFGIKAVSKKETSNPEKYHERVWGISTYWGLKLLAVQEPGLAKTIMGNYLKYMNSNNLYGMPETITSAGVPKGATHQLWSVAFIPEIYDMMRGFSVGDKVKLPLRPGIFKTGKWRIEVSR